MTNDNYEIFKKLVDALSDRADPNRAEPNYINCLNELKFARDTANWEHVNALFTALDIPSMSPWNNPGSDQLPAEDKLMLQSLRLLNRLGFMTRGTTQVDSQWFSLLNEWRSSRPEIFHFYPTIYYSPTCPTDFTFDPDRHPDFIPDLILSDNQELFDDLLENHISNLQNDDNQILLETLQMTAMLGSTNMLTIITDRLVSDGLDNLLNIRVYNGDDPGRVRVGSCLSFTFMLDVMKHLVPQVQFNLSNFDYLVNVREAQVDIETLKDAISMASHSAYNGDGVNDDYAVVFEVVKEKCKQTQPENEIDSAIQNWVNSLNDDEASQSIHETVLSYVTGNNTRPHR